MSRSGLPPTEPRRVEDWTTPMHQRILRASPAGGRANSGLRSLGFHAESPSPADVLSGCRARMTDRKARDVESSSRSDTLRLKLTELVARKAAADTHMPPTLPPGWEREAAAAVRLQQIRDGEAQLREAEGRLVTSQASSRNLNDRIADRRHAIDDATRRLGILRNTIRADEEVGAALLQPYGVDVSAYRGVPALVRTWDDATAAATAIVTAGDEIAVRWQAANDERNSAQQGILAAEASLGRERMVVAEVEGREQVIRSAQLSSVRMGSESQEVIAQETRAAEELRAEMSTWRARHDAAQAELVKRHRANGLIHRTELVEVIVTDEQVAAEEARADQLRHEVQELTAELDSRPDPKRTGLDQLQRQVLALSDAVASARAQLSDASGNILEAIHGYEASIQMQEAHLLQVAAANERLGEELSTAEATDGQTRVARTSHERRQGTLQREIDDLEAALSTSGAGGTADDEDRIRGEIESSRAELEDLHEAISAATAAKRKHAAAVSSPSVVASPSPQRTGNRWGPLSWLGL
jgi:chromosome segregation ATPase